jgi:hypothetical protein
MYFGSKIVNLKKELSFFDYVASCVLFLSLRTRIHIEKDTRHDTMLNTPLLSIRKKLKTPCSPTGIINAKKTKL